MALLIDEFNFGVNLPCVRLYALRTRRILNISSGYEFDGRMILLGGERGIFSLNCLACH